MSEQPKKSGSGIEGYRLLKKLGKGGMATVYLGVQECFDRQVAIKVMHPNPADPSFGERFIREAKIISKLSQPNIVPVYDVGISGKHNFMAMEYLPGGDLSSRIEQGISTSEAIRITKEVAAALDYAHNKGYVHRDVKPDNIMFKEDGTAVLTDFGIARPNTPDSNMTQIGKVIGTPKYMSPEQSKGDELDGRSDLYALGIMLYEMLTGNVPFDGNNAFDIGIKHLKDPVPPLPGNVQQFQPVINQLLAKNINKRIQTGRQLIDVLGQVDVRITKDDTQQMSAHTSETNAITQTDYNSEEITARVESTAEDSGIHADSSDRVEEIIIPKDNTGPIIVGSVVTVAIISLLLGAIWFAPSIAPNSFLMGPHNALMAMLYPGRAELQQALANAQTAMDEERYLEPADNSALFFYNEVLGLDAGNSEAEAGLDKIISIYVEKALADIDENLFDKAEKLLMDAKQVKGETPEIIAALDTLDQKKIALASSAEDARLAAEAAAKRKAAEEKARKAALLAQQRAEEDAARAASEKARLAAEAEAEAARLKAEEEARLAAEAEAEAARLKAEDEARQQALQAQAKQRMLKLQVTGLLNKADTYMARGDYRSPAQENALEKYLAAKKLDSSSERAQAGIEKVVTILIPEIDELLKAQQFSMAKNLFEQLIGAAPDHPDLIEIGQSKGW